MIARAAVLPKIIAITSMFVFFALCALCIFGGAISHGTVLAPEDNLVQNYPAFACRTGLWTPLLLTGFPLLADPQIQFFYPLALVAKCITTDMATNFNIYVISAFILSAFFAGLLGRRLSGSFYGGLVAGISYGFSGFLISELKHVQVLHTAIWLPVLFYLIELVGAKPEEKGWKPVSTLQKTLLSGAIAAITCVMIFAGHPQTSFYILVAATIYAIVLAGPQKFAPAHLWPTFVGLGFALAFAAVQLIPSFELSQFSARSQFTYKDMIVGQVEPMQLVGFLMPYLLGGSYGTIGNMPFADQGAPPGLMFFGLGPLVLAGLATAMAISKERKRFFVTLSILTMLLAIGSLTPFAHLVYMVPFFGKFRGLYRVLILAAFSIAMLAAYGMAAIESGYFLRQWKDLGLKRHLLLCVYVVCASLSYIFLVGTAPILFAVFHNRVVDKLRLSSQAIFRHLPLVLIVVTIFGALATYGLKGEWTQVSVDRNTLRAPPNAKYYAEVTEREQCRLLPVIGIGAPLDHFPPNLSRLWHVANASGYEPLISSRYAALLKLSEGGFMRPPWHFAGDNRAFDITSTRFIIAQGASFYANAFDEKAKSYWHIARSWAGAVAIQNDRCLPRFYTVEQYRRLKAEAILAAITAGKFADGKAFEPSAEVLLEDEKVGAQESNLPAALSSIKALRLENEHLQFSVKVERPSYFVLADTFYPGWTATIDGAPAPVLPANYVQRAVLIPPGNHLLKMDFDSPSLATGKLVSAGALALFMAILLIVFIASKSGKQKADE